MVAYVWDANAILAAPIRNRSKATLVESYSMIYDQLKTVGLQPKFQICDNECPKVFCRFLKKRDIQLQLIPPYKHQMKPDEKDIDTYKSHFLLGLASLPPNFSSPSMGLYGRTRHHHSQPPPTVQIEPHVICVCTIVLHVWLQLNTINAGKHGR